MQSADSKSLIRVTYSRFIDSFRPLCEMWWAHIFLSDHLKPSVPARSFCVFVHINGWSHSYASWISNTCLRRGWMSAMWWTALFLRPDNPSVLAARTVGTRITRVLKVSIVLCLISGANSSKVTAFYLCFTKYLQHILYNWQPFRSVQFKFPLCGMNKGSILHLIS